MHLLSKSRQLWWNWLIAGSLAILLAPGSAWLHVLLTAGVGHCAVGARYCASGLGHCLGECHANHSVSSHGGWEDGLLEQCGGNCPVQPVGLTIGSFAEGAEVARDEWAYLDRDATAQETRTDECRLVDSKESCECEQLARDNTTATGTACHPEEGEPGSFGIAQFDRGTESSDGVCLICSHFSLAFAEPGELRFEISTPVCLDEPPASEASPQRVTSFYGARGPPLC